MRKELARCVSQAQAVVDLMKPYVEVVLHDLKTETIAAIFNNYSGRVAGDPSELGADKGAWNNAPDYYSSYIRVGKEGNRIKSTTAVVRDDKGRAVGLFCINFDLAALDGIKSALDAFGSLSQALPKDLFEEDWSEKIKLYIHEYISERTLRIDALDRDQRKALISDLYSRGAFAPKHAAEMIANVLGISRATIYKDLAEVKS